MAFKDLETTNEIKDYLRNVLSRTGGKTKKSSFLYHYTSIANLERIVEGRYLWLGSTKNMNDYLEGEYIDSAYGDNRVFFSCFSRVEENLAMYKMYAPSPSGVMLGISFSTAAEIVNGQKKNQSKKSILRIVRDKVLTEDVVEADVY